MIVQFGGNFAPRGWALCDGQLLSINSNSALFSILGTTYGGDGVSTFGLPDLRGRVAMHAGTGPGLTPRNLGAKSGSETNTLTTNQIPSHKHTANISTSPNTDNASGNIPSQISGQPIYSSNKNSTVTMGSEFINNTGGGQPVNNVQPFQVVNFIIALQGTYPSRS